VPDPASPPNKLEARFTRNSNTDGASTLEQRRDQCTSRAPGPSPATKRKTPCCEWASFTTLCSAFRRTGSGRVDPHFRQGQSPTLVLDLRFPDRRCRVWRRPEFPTQASVAFVAPALVATKYLGRKHRFSPLRGTGRCRWMRSLDCQRHDGSLSTMRHRRGCVDPRAELSHRHEQLRRRFRSNSDSARDRRTYSRLQTGVGGAKQACWRSAPPPPCLATFVGRRSRHVGGQIFLPGSSSPLSEGDSNEALWRGFLAGHFGWSTSDDGIGRQRSESSRPSPFGFRQSRSGHGSGLAGIWTGSAMVKLNAKKLERPLRNHRKFESKQPAICTVLSDFRGMGEQSWRHSG